MSLRNQIGSQRYAPHSYRQIEAQVNQTKQELEAIMSTVTVPSVHIMYGGNQYDWTLEEMDLGELSTDAEILHKVADFISAPYSKVQNFFVDRNTDTGDITVRAQAVFGG